MKYLYGMRLHNNRKKENRRKKKIKDKEFFYNSKGIITMLNNLQFYTQPKESITYEHTIHY